MTSHYRCTCGLIDAHAHCLPPAYRQALSDAGFTSLDGGYPIPSWSAEKAFEVMDANGIDTMMLSVSSPSVGFLPDEAARVKLAHRINEDVAQTVKAQSGPLRGLRDAAFAARRSFAARDRTCVRRIEAGWRRHRDEH